MTGVLVALVVVLVVVMRSPEPEDRVEKMTRDIERWKRLRRALRPGR